MGVENELRFCQLRDQQVARLKNMVAGGWGGSHVRLEAGQMTGWRLFPNRRAMVAVIHGEATLLGKDGKWQVYLSAKDGFSAAVIPADSLHVWHSMTDDTVILVFSEETEEKFFIDAVLAEAEPIHKASAESPPSTTQKKKARVKRAKIKKSATRKRKA